MSVDVLDGYLCRKIRFVIVYYRVDVDCWCYDIALKPCTVAEIVSRICTVFAHGSTRQRLERLNQSTSDGVTVTGCSMRYSYSEYSETAQMWNCDFKC